MDRYKAVSYTHLICEKVLETLGATPENKVILNLPNTVEMSTPNHHADQIEYFCRHLKHRDCAIISLHPHNDRGTGTAATELGILAGAERVEGTLFGNGERTGNADIMNVAMNMYSQGVDPAVSYTPLKASRPHTEAGRLLFAKNGFTEAAPRTPFPAPRQTRPPSRRGRR